MPNMQDDETTVEIVLVGCGGFGQEIATYISEMALEHAFIDVNLTVTDVVDKGEARFDDIENVLKSKPRRHIDYSTVERLQHKKWVLCFGDPVARHREYNRIRSLGCTFFTVIHPLSSVSATATIADGCIVAPFVFVGPFANIGSNCAINVHSTIGHDTKLGHSVVVSPHVDINGSVDCGDCTFFGSGVIVHPGVKIGRFVKIASASVVKQTVGDGELVAGNPAKGRKMFIVPSQNGE
jgi:sugar O-acyltransferase (sialic acid O-acetyltransferase NeuD family)